MMRSTTIAIAILCGGLWACPPASEGTTGTSAGASDEQEAPEDQATEEPAPASAYADLPVPADYADEAATEIDEENYESALDELESELAE